MNTTLPTLRPLDAQSPVALASAPIAAVQRQLGFAPTVYLAMGQQPALLEAYRAAYDQFRQHGGFDAIDQELLLLTVSRFHDCGYCVAAHSMVADRMAHMPADWLAALREGRPVPDAKRAALQAFAQALLQERGWIDPDALRAFLAAGYEERQVLGVILAIAVKTMSNYTNHAFGLQPDPAFAAYALPPMKEAA
jgi:uncharacterized peroxidase-related enzyme